MRFDDVQRVLPVDELVKHPAMMMAAFVGVALGFRTRKALRSVALDRACRLCAAR